MCYPRAIAQMVNQQSEDNRKDSGNIFTYQE